MKTYQGHRSWNAWNVSLWISNTEAIYNYALMCLRDTARKGKQSAGRAATLFMRGYVGMRGYAGERTPDGGFYNHLSVKLCLQGFIED